MVTIEDWLRDLESEVSDIRNSIKRLESWVAEIEEKIYELLSELREKKVM